MSTAFVLYWEIFLDTSRLDHNELLREESHVQMVISQVKEEAKKRKKYNELIDMFDDLYD